MECDYQQVCGGCEYRDMFEEKYQIYKENTVKSVLKKIKQDDISFGETVFIHDGLRRRTSLSFEFSEGNLVIGYNQKRTNKIIDVYNCCLLTKSINNNLLNIRELLEAVYNEPFIVKNKKKIESSYLQKGNVYICEADNGLDVVLEFDKELALQHRVQIVSSCMNYNEIIRVSHRRKDEDVPEVIMEKIKPVINIKGFTAQIPAGAFLQASKQSETALIDLVLKYVGKTSGKCLDLFCGLGTFSYPLSMNIKNKIIAADSSDELLKAFENSINMQMIPNIKVVRKNLFKYPFSGDELKNCAIVVFDPPRSGALAQVKEIAKLDESERPEKIIAVSCNPETFVNDANVLIDANYKISEITIVDQFIYSAHAELVALFEKK